MSTQASLDETQATEDGPSEESHAVPDELMDRDQWLCWEVVEDDDGRERKMPRVPDGSWNPASTSDPSTWGSFDEAYNACQQRKGVGLGFVLTEDDPFLAVDFDDVRDPDSGETEDWVLDAIDRWDAYTEISPSGTGIHVWLKDVPEPDWWVDTEHIEVYDSGQYITVTGEHFSETPTRCASPAKFEGWLQERADLDVPEPPSQESQDTPDGYEEDFNLGVYAYFQLKCDPESVDREFQLRSHG